MAAVGVRAYDFSLTVGSGQTLYFNIQGTSVEVTYPNNSSYPVNGWNGFTRPVGDLVIPANVTHEGVVYNVVAIGQLAFYECTGLTSVVIGEGVTTLGNSAFNGCTALTTTVIPSTIDTIGLRAFGECHQLASVWCNKTTLPGTSAYAFYNVSLTNSTLHVPSEALSLYGAATPWSAFGSILGDGPIVALSLATNDVERGMVSGGGLYNVGSVREITALPNDGYSFICWNDGVSQNPRQLTLLGNMNLTAMFFPLIHDTISVRDTIARIDTVVQYDTLVPVLCRLQVFSSQESLGMGVGTTQVPVGTEVEICALPLGGRFEGWSDGSTENPRRVTMTGDLSFTAFFEQLSIVSPDAVNWQVYTEGNEVVVEGASGLKTEVYDAKGCRVAEGLTPFRMMLPTAGVYVVRVGDLGARKVTVE